MHATPRHAKGDPHPPKTEAARMSPTPSKERDRPIMSRPMPPITFTDQERAEVADLTTVLYRKALRLIEEANQFRQMADPKARPVEVPGLYAILIPRQAVSR